MRHLSRFVRQSFDSFAKTIRDRLMASVSECEPSPQKRLKTDSEFAESRTTDEDNAWRSKLIRSFEEPDVGITEFIGQFKPFEGILKNRYEDFVVHEISKSGEILRLTDNSQPVDDVSPVLDMYEVLEEGVINDIRKLVDNQEMDEEVVEEVDEVISEEVVVDSEETDTCGADNQTNEQTVDSKEVENSSKVSDSVRICVNSLSKFERTRIHKTIRENFDDLETVTVDEGEDKYIVVKRIDAKTVKRRANPWPKEKGEYIHFILFKENIDTHQGITHLALKMGVSAKNFNVAGNKDKRAVTTQRVSAYKVPPYKIWLASKRCRNLETGHFQYEKEPLNLGDLKGNHFDIVLRDVKCSDRTDADQSLESLRTVGFINYYGMQRFGYSHQKPHTIGVSIVHQKWEEVVNKILCPKPHDMHIRKRFGNRELMSFNEGIELWRETNNALKVYKRFPFKSSPEGTLLRGLSRVGPTDFHAAIISGMMRSQRLLYLHCYQSYLWNKIASYRIRTYGLKVVVGDLLKLDDSETQDNEEEEEPKRGYQEKDINKNIVIADEETLKTATIYDIVLPQFGSDTQLPMNSVTEYLESLMAEDSVTFDMFRALPKEWSSHGAYRKLFVRPDNFDYEWLTYDDPDVSLVDTDLTLIQKKKLLSTELATDSAPVEPSEVKSSGEPKVALKVSMSLPSSCYATMAFRQITGTETTVLEYKDWFKSKYNL